MTTIPVSKISPETLQSAGLLYGHGGELPYYQNEHAYFSAERAIRSSGASAIILTRGTFGDDGGYEASNSQITLSYAKDGSLRSIKSREDFEPAGQLLTPSSAGSDPSQKSGWTVPFLRERTKRQEATEQAAARYIATALSLFEKSAD